MTGSNPAPRDDTDWLDRDEYPFASHEFRSTDGVIHYVDEGQGAPVVFVHGTPTWSFLYRHMMRDLSRDHRCIALDHLGFGLSDKPASVDLRPAAHARRFAEFIEHLGLDRFTLVVHDFGGPIGISYAIEHPEAIRSLAVMNTWLGSLRGRVVPELAGFAGRGPLGTLLLERMNLELRVLFPLVWGDRSKLTPEVRAHYFAPFRRRADRASMSALARELRGSHQWYESLWSKRDQLRPIPAMIFWGRRDWVFGRRHLRRWQGVFETAETVELPLAGHFVQEEAPDAIVEGLRRLLGA